MPSNELTMLYVVFFYCLLVFCLFCWLHCHLQVDVSFAVGGKSCHVYGNMLQISILQTKRGHEHRNLNVCKTKAYPAKPRHTLLIVLWGLAILTRQSHDLPWLNFILFPATWHSSINFLAHQAHHHVIGILKPCFNATLIAKITVHFSSKHLRCFGKQFSVNIHVDDRRVRAFQLSKYSRI